MKHPKRNPTEEELKNDKKTILELFKNGIPIRRMEAQLDMPKSYITKVRGMLITEGLITEEEIKSAYAEYLKENPPAQGLNKTKVYKPKGTEKAERRHNKSIATKEKVLELLQQKYAQTEIARELGISATSVKLHTKTLIEEGRIKKEDIRKATNKDGMGLIDRSDPEYIAKRNVIVEYLKQGYKSNFIRDKLGITSYDYNVYVRDIKYKKILTSKQIEEARQRKREEDIEFVAEHVIAGYTITEMTDLRPEFSANEVTPIIKQLVEAGRITQEQVDQNRKNGNRRTINKTAKLSADEQLEFIIKKVKKGYSPQEIVNSDKTKTLTIHKVLYQKRRIIVQGIISQEEADRAMKKRQDRNLSRKHGKAIDRIRELTMQGYSLKEISEMIGYGASYISKLKCDYEREHGWFSKEELKEFLRQRGEREAEEARIAFEKLPFEERIRIEEERRQEALRLEEEQRRLEEEKRQQSEAKKREKKEAKDEKHRQDIETIKKEIKKQKSVKQIAEKMKCSIAYVYKLIKESQANGTWFSDRQLKSIQKKKAERKEAKIELEKSQKAERKEANKAQRESDREERELQEIWQIRDLVTQGLTTVEIAEKMHYGTAHINVLRRKAREKNIWFSDEAIREFKEQRRIREDKEAEAKRLEEQKRLDKQKKEEEKAAKEELQRAKAFESAMRRKTQALTEPYKRARKKAKHEDTLEFNGKENVSTEGRREFIDVLIKLHKIGASISEKDIEMALNAFYLHPELATNESIKFLISDAARKGGFKAANDVVVELMKSLGETKYREPLVQYRRWLIKRSYIPKIKVLKAQGLSNTEVGKKLGITSLEVVTLLEDKKEDRIFEDDSK